MNTYLAIDLGGTNVRVAMADENGKILAMETAGSEADREGTYLVDKIVSIASKLPGIKDCKAAGMGIPGVVDKRRKRICYLTNLPNFGGYQTIELLEQKLGLPVYLENDANLACLAESILGAGKGFQSVYYVTISTGIGGGYVSEGRIISGNHGFAGEIGGMRVKISPAGYYGLPAGAVEGEASGTAITRKGQAVPGLTVEHAGDVFRLAKEGDQRAKEIVGEMTEDISVMLSSISYVIDPEVFVLGGGCMKSADVFWNDLIEKYKALVPAQLRETVFVTASLEEPGVMGAVLYAKQQVE